MFNFFFNVKGEIYKLFKLEICCRLQENVKELKTKNIHIQTDAISSFYVLANACLLENVKKKNTFHRNWGCVSLLQDLNVKVR